MKVPVTTPNVDGEQQIDMFLSGFLQDPESFDIPDLSTDDLWEQVVNPVLHETLGYGLSNDISEKITTTHRAAVQGFARWLDYYIVRRGVDEGMVEMRMERLFTALESM